MNSVHAGLAMFATALSVFSVVMFVVNLWFGRYHGADAMVLCFVVNVIVAVVNYTAVT